MTALPRTCGDSKRPGIIENVISAWSYSKQQPEPNLSQLNPTQEPLTVWKDALRSLSYLKRQKNT